MGGVIVERGLRAPQIAIVLKSKGRAHVCVCVGETLVTFLTMVMLERLCAHAGWRDKRQTDNEIGRPVPPSGWEQDLDLPLLSVCPSW